MTETQINSSNGNLIFEKNNPCDNQVCLNWMNFFCIKLKSKTAVLKCASVGEMGWISQIGY